MPIILEKWLVVFRTLSVTAALSYLKLLGSYFPWPSEFYVILTVGMDFYLTYFKFSPVIVLSMGMNNMLFKEEPNLYSNALDKLLSKVLLIAITFE